MINLNELKEELERLARVNLDKGTFAGKRDIVIKPGIRIHPFEDLENENSMLFEFRQRY